MTNFIWLGGVGATLWLVWVSFLAGHRWWLPYLGAVFMGLGAGFLLWDWPEWLSDLWWLGFMIYIVVFPIYRLSERKARDEEHYRGW